MLLSVIIQTVVLYVILAYVLVMLEMAYVRYFIDTFSLSKEEFNKMFQGRSSLFRFFHSSYEDYTGLINHWQKAPRPILEIIVIVVICFMMVTQAFRVPTMEHHIIFGLASVIAIYSVWRSRVFIVTAEAEFKKQRKL